jgi:hypothetical protein
MLTNLRFSDLRLTTAQQRTTGQNLPSEVYFTVRFHNSLQLTRVNAGWVQLKEIFLYLTQSGQVLELNQTYQISTDASSPGGQNGRGVNQLLLR